MFSLVTKMASGREVSLSLRPWFIAKIQGRGTLVSAVTVTGHCDRCLKTLHTMLVSTAHICGYNLKTGS